MPLHLSTRLSTSASLEDVLADTSSQNVKPVGTLSPVYHPRLSLLSDGTASWGNSMLLSICFPPPLPPHRSTSVNMASSLLYVLTLVCHGRYESGAELPKTDSIVCRTNCPLAIPVYRPRQCRVSVREWLSGEWGWRVGDGVFYVSFVLVHLFSSCH